MSAIVTALVVVAAILLGIALAYVPMRLLLAQIAKNVREFIQRQRDRRRAPRDTPDRRKEDAAQPVASTQAPKPPSS